MPPNSRPNRTMLRRALFLLAACGIAAFAVLMLQLFRLQILRHDELESAALQQQLRRAVLFCCIQRFFRRLSHLAASFVPTLWKSCTSRMSRMTAAYITRYL